MADDATRLLELHTSNRDRRSDTLRAVVVQRGVELQRRNGDVAAHRFMTSQAIAEHIILRVLAGAAFRRKRAA